MKEDVRAILDELLLKNTRKNPLANKTLSQSIGKYKDAKEFAYGQRSGMLLGTVFGYHIGKYGVNPNEKEFLEIVEVIQMKREDIQNPKD